MSNLLRTFVKRILPRFVINKLRAFSDREQYQVWKNSGQTGPPPHLVKQMIIREFQKKYGCHVLVETGTYKGDMVQAQKKRFDKIYSVELSSELFEKAKERFRKDRNITILQGDSGKVLPFVLTQINEPAIFWLDGHYSSGITASGEKDCPIIEELEAIFQSKSFDHILLIDDARLFTGKGDYPTISKLTEFIKSRNPNYRVAIKDDVIRYSVE